MRCSSRLLLISLAAIAACARGVRVQTDDVTVPDDVTSPSAPISTRVLGDIARRVLGFVPWRFVAAFVDDDKVRIWRGSRLGCACWGAPRSLGDVTLLDM